MSNNKLDNMYYNSIRFFFPMFRVSSSNVRVDICLFKNYLKLRYHEQFSILSSSIFVKETFMNYYIGLIDKIILYYLMMCQKMSKINT